MSANHPALPPTGLSPPGFQVRRNAEILKKLLKTQPTQNHGAKAKLLRISFKHFQTFPIEAQENYYKLLGQCQESRDLYHIAISSAALISENHATICATVTALTRQLLSTSQPPLEDGQRVALSRQLSGAVVEHDKVFEQLEMFKQEAENLRRWWDYYWREAKSRRELADSLWDEYDVLVDEAEDVMEELRRLEDQSVKSEKEADDEEVVVSRPLGLD